MSEADMNDNDEIVRIVLEHYPNTQAIYLFGTYDTPDVRPDSDADIAVLLRPADAREAGSLAMADARPALETLLGRDVDLINLRRVPTVLQKEVVMTDRRIHTADEIGAEEFEMLTLSFYQKLNEERAEIVAAALAGGRFYQV